jgi:hypothetical protein
MRASSTLVAEILFQFFIFDFNFFNFFVVLKTLETNSALQAINAMEKRKKKKYQFSVHLTLPPGILTYRSENA